MSADNFNMADLNSALNDGGRADLVNVLKTKLHDLAGQYTEALENLPPEVRKRVEILRESQSQHDDLEAKFFEERSALEAKYQLLYQPLYAKRFEIVNGNVERCGDYDGTPMDSDKGVPGFWVIALKNNEVVGEEITERDEGALRYLNDIKWCRINDPKGFRLEFLFDGNPYFKNAVLTKTYHMIDEDEPILEKATGTEIEWYPGKCLTQKLLKRKPKKGSRNAKPITKTEDCESFFNFFNPPQVPENGDDLDDDTADELQSQMEQDYAIGSTIRDKIIPHAVSWFTGEAIEADEIELEDEEEEEDVEEDEDEDGENDAYVDRIKKNGAMARGNGEMQDEQPPECKQQ